MNKNEVLKQVDQFLSNKRSYNVKKTNKSFTIKEEIEVKEQAPHKPTVEYLKTFMYENFATKEDIKNINNRIDKLDNRITMIEIRMNNLETKVDAGFKLILDTLARNGMK